MAKYKSSKASVSLKFAVISDLHVYTETADNKGNPPSHYKTADTTAPILQHPMRSLLAFARDRQLTADVLICCGDLGDKADKDGISEAWRTLHELATILKVKRVVATPGNHDIDSRFQKSEYDAKGYLQSLSPPFPLRQEEENDRFWARHFAVIHDPGGIYRIIVLNSSAYHGYSLTTPPTATTVPEYQHGRISPFTLDRIRLELTAHSTPLVNLLVCHHHPQLNEEIAPAPDYDRMKDGQKLLQLLSEPKYGDWLVVHGHMHHPKICYAQGGTNAPTIFSAGSLSAILSQSRRHIQNQFYIVDFDLAHLKQWGLVGRIYAWDWSFGTGMRPALASSGIPALAGFGYHVNAKDIATKILNVVTSKADHYMQWSDLINDIPELQYILGADLLTIARELQTLGVSVSPDHWPDKDGHFEELQVSGAS